MILYSGGTFSTIHVGHIDLLKWCRSLVGEGGKVVIALNTDEFIEEYKGKPPVDTYEHRKEMLLATRYVDEVIPNYGGADSKPAILSVMPDIIAIGSDWMKRDYCKQMSFTPDWLEENRIALVYIPRYIDMSSTKVRESIKNA